MYFFTYRKLSLMTSQRILATQFSSIQLCEMTSNYCNFKTPKATLFRFDKISILYTVKLEIGINYALHNEIKNHLITLIDFFASLHLQQHRHMHISHIHMSWFRDTSDKEKWEAITQFIIYQYMFYQQLSHYIKFICSICGDLFASLSRSLLGDKFQDCYEPVKRKR